MGVNEGMFKNKADEFKGALSKNQDYFLSLPEESRAQLESKRVEILREDVEFSFFQKLYSLFRELFMEEFPFRQTFLAAGFIGALFILLDHPLVFLFLFIGTAAPIIELSNLPKTSKIEVLPTEEFLISHYIDKNFNQEPILSQMKLLQEALDRFFGETFGNSSFFKKEGNFQEQVARGKWLYQAEKLLSKIESPSESGSSRTLLIFESLLGMIILTFAFSSKIAHLIKTNKAGITGRMKLP